MRKFFAAGSGELHPEGSDDLSGKISAARNGGNVSQEDGRKLSRRRLVSKKSPKIRRKRFYVRQLGSKSAICVSQAKAQNLAAGLWRYVRHRRGVVCCKVVESVLQVGCKCGSRRLNEIVRKFFGEGVGRNLDGTRRFFGSCCRKLGTKQ